MQKFLILILVVVMLGACTNEQTPTSIGDSPNPSPVLANPATPSPSTTTSPIPPSVTKISPTSTPNLYSVELNDTLIGIARKFNITLEELLAVNPNVGSQALTVGTILVIPVQQKVETEPTATPWPVSIQQTHCYKNQDASLWCLALIKNENAEALQNISIEISLLDSSGNEISAQTAYAPLDLLLSGRSIAIGVLFNTSIPVDYLIQTEILSASRLPSSDKHYPLIHFQNYLVQVDWGGLSARVSGQAALDIQSETASRVWILALAYDESGNVIGFRRWESNNSFSGEDALSFDFWVSSLGPEIDHVDLLIEAAK